MDSKRLYLLCYDISSPDRWRGVVKLAQDHGVRLQYSVFLLHVTPAVKDELVSRLEKVINPREDDVRIYPLPETPEWETWGRPLFVDGVVLNMPLPKRVDERENGSVEDFFGEDAFDDDE